MWQREGVVVGEVGVAGGVAMEVDILELKGEHFSLPYRLDSQFLSFIYHLFMFTPKKIYTGRQI